MNPYEDFGQIQKEKIHDGKYSIKTTNGKVIDFRVRTQSEDATFAPGSRVISLRKGPDYVGFAFVHDNGRQINRWRNKHGDADWMYIAALFTRVVCENESDKGESLKAFIPERKS